MKGPGGKARIVLIAIANDHAATTYRDRVYAVVVNSSNSTIGVVVSTSTTLDGTDHTLFFSYDADAGNATLYIDGVDEHDTGHGDDQTDTGTLDTGAASLCSIGSGVWNSANLLVNGNIGFCGYRDAYLTNPLDFMDGADPKQIDESSWTEWGAQPLYWNQYGTMTTNLGSAGDMILTGDVGFGTGVPYRPPMMLFDGSSGYYVDSSTSIPGSDFTFTTQFNLESFTGGGIKRLINFSGSGGNRLIVLAYASDHATTTRRDKIAAFVQNAGSDTLVLTFGINDDIDGEDHVLFFSFDGSAGDIQYFIDGVNADDTGNPERVVISGTPVNSGGNFRIGASTVPADYWAGQIGFVGYSNDYLTNPLDFMDADGPKEIDESGWTEWGSQPLYWNKYGIMTDNQGSQTGVTKQGTITGPT